MLPSPPLDQAACSGAWIAVVVRRPETVCHPDALLVGALRSIGVALHPGFGFQSFVDDDGPFWRWLLAPQTADRLYQTTDLIKWWHDPVWLAAHPAHEWAIARATLHNLALQAREIRETVSLLVIRRGKSEAHIPANASPARRAHLLGQLEGRIPFNAVFSEPLNSQPSTLNPE